MSNESGQIIAVRTADIPGLQFAIKRAIDVVVALAGGLLVLPLLGIIAFLIRLDSPGPVLFRQRRIGKGGRPFELIKFRTMKDNSEQSLAQHLDQDSDRRLDWQAYQKLFQDPRLTRLGAFLRKTSLDEFPQLWNVLRGEMSLIGPRPFLPEQLEAYGAAYRYYVQVRPGMTGLWQVSGRNWLSFAERTLWDVVYVRQWSLGLDLKILARTVGVVLFRRGAF